MWYISCQEAFTKVMYAVSDKTLLTYPDDSEIYIVQCDGSGGQVGAVLLQEQGGILCPFQYISHTLDKYQQKHYVPVQECYAVLWSVQKFRRSF